MLGYQSWPRIEQADEEPILRAGNLYQHKLPVYDEGREVTGGRALQRLTYVYPHRNTRAKYHLDSSRGYMLGENN